MQMSAPMPGFENQVLQSLSAFRTIMNAMAQPGKIYAAPSPVPDIGNLNPVSAMIALTLCDYDTPIWLDPALCSDETVSAFLKFHTSAPITKEPIDSAFAFFSSGKLIDNFDQFAAGSDEYPDESTTLVVAVDALTNATGATLEGPGIETNRTFNAAPLPTSFWSLAKANHALYPRGRDVIFVTATHLACLPRSTRIAKGA